MWKASLILFFACRSGTHNLTQFFEHTFQTIQRIGTIWYQTSTSRQDSGELVFFWCFSYFFKLNYTPEILHRYQKLPCVKGDKGSYLFQGPSFWGPPAVSWLRSVWYFSFQEVSHLTMEFINQSFAQWPAALMKSTKLYRSMRITRLSHISNPWIESIPPGKDRWRNSN